MKSAGFLIHIAITLHIVQQVKAELVKSQIHDGNAVGHILDIHDFLLQTFQLRLAVFEIALFFRIDQIIITGGCHDGNLHAGLHTGREIDIIIQCQVRPEVYKLYRLVPAANAVDTSKTLNNAHRIPVDIVID